MSLRRASRCCRRPGSRRHSLRSSSTSASSIHYSGIALYTLHECFVILGVPGVIAFTLDLYYLAGWPVLHATVSSVGMGQAEYAYEVDGRRYTGTEQVGRSPTLKPADTIVVHYDPALPSQHRTMGLSSNLPFLGIGGAAAIAAAGLVASALLVLLMGWSLWKLNLTGGRCSGPHRRRRAH